MEKILGIDVGATGTKGGIVDLKKGDLISEKIKLRTPDSKKPGDMIEVINQLVQAFEWEGKPVGMGFPTIIKDNKCWSASNIDESWIGFEIKREIELAANCPVYVINDADAAGLAEMKYGKGYKQKGTVILLTLGTGIGSALFINGKLVPNTEFGQLKFRDGVTENFASNSARLAKNMSWEKFGNELNEVLKYIDFIFSPQMIILGGGISKNMDMYQQYFDKELNVYPAEKFNNAGIIGAALAYKKYTKK